MSYMYGEPVAAKRVESLGPTGDLVRERVAETRRFRGLSYAELSRRLAEAGRPIPPLGLSRIESGERRVDVDDLVALASALHVAPVWLLVPWTFGPSTNVDVTGLGSVPARVALKWLSGYEEDRRANLGESLGWSSGQDDDFWDAKPGQLDVDEILSAARGYRERAEEDGDEAWNEAAQSLETFAERVRRARLRMIASSSTDREPGNDAP